MGARGMGTGKGRESALHEAGQAEVDSNGNNRYF